MEIPEADGPVPAEENIVPDGVEAPGGRPDERVEWPMNLPEVDPGGDGSTGSEVSEADAPSDTHPSDDEAPLTPGDAADEPPATDAVADAGDEASGSESPTEAVAQAADADDPDAAEELEEHTGLDEHAVTLGHEQRRSPVPWWPYLVYIVVWIGLAAGLAYVGMQTGTTFLSDSVAYPYLVLGGLIMTLLGPLLGVGAWMLARRRVDQGARSGLFVAALLRASLFTVGGVALFWGALVLVDALRLDWL